MYVLNTVSFVLKAFGESFVWALFELLMATGCDKRLSRCKCAHHGVATITICGCVHQMHNDSTGGDDIQLLLVRHS